MNQYNRAYQDLIDMINERGWSVISRNMPEADGKIFPEEKEIHIDNPYSNTLYGCFVLAHELGHLIDFINGKFKRYFAMNFPSTISKKWFPPSYIRKVESSADNFAKEFFKFKEFGTKNIPSFNPYYFDTWNIPNWTFYYNGFSVRDISKEIKKLHEEAKIRY